MFNDVRRIEIEISSYCNRKCEWCSNKTCDRSFKQDMPEETFVRLLTELKNNDFATANRRLRALSGYISFSKFSEPMADIDLLINRVDKTREIILNTNLIVATNGDYISYDKIKDLNIDNLLISDYDCKGYDYAMEVLRSLKCIIIRDEKNGVIYASNKYISNIRYQYDWPLHNKIEDMAGYLKEDIYCKGQQIVWRGNKQPRQIPCIEPEWYISVDYLGNVSPCSYIRCEIPEHKEFIFGNINENSLKEIMNSKAWMDFRNRVNNTTDLSGLPDICKHCNKLRKKCSDERVLYEEIFI